MHGESYYRDKLAGTVANLQAKGLAVESPSDKCSAVIRVSNDPLREIQARSSPGDRHPVADLSTGIVPESGSSLRLVLVVLPTATTTRMVNLSLMSKWLPLPMLHCTVNDYTRIIQLGRKSGKSISRVNS